ncbi:MAG: hypothetical protein NTV81_04865 [Candidatus Komeilibacteria bacterium]|nr:hypothetical protein [Candidatus Komeilibacteria bacterium]
MSNQELAEQKNFYNQGYEKIYLGEVGFPDLKIVDYNPAITTRRF